VAIAYGVNVHAAVRCMEVMTTMATRKAPPGGAPWAWLLRYVWQADVSACSRCGGPMKWVEVATEPEAIGRVLAELELTAVGGRFMGVRRGRICARGFAQTLGIELRGAPGHGRVSRPIGPACDHSYPPSQGISQFVFLIRSISGRSGKRSRDPSETSARCPPPLAGRLPVG
jgi:hypothetical protein